MEEYKIVEEIYQAIETHGLMKTIGKLFGAGARIRLPFSERACNTKIDDLNLSVRSYNGLMRAGLTTVDKIIDYMQEDKLLNIRNLGKNSKAEINVRIYEFGYNCLSERARKEFAKNLFELNKDMYKTS